MTLLSFDYKSVFRVLNRLEVNYLLVGGLNFFLIHKPVSTQDIDVFIDDTPSNRRQCELALADLDASWGKLDEEWGPVRDKTAGWLSSQGVYCTLTRFGPLDVFRSIAGISAFSRAEAVAISFQFSESEFVKLISASDLLSCQLSLPEQYRKQDRVSYLKEILKDLSR